MSISTAPGSHVLIVNYQIPDLWNTGMVPARGIWVDSDGDDVYIMRLGKDNDFSAITHKIAGSSITGFDQAVIGDDHLPTVLYPHVQVVRQVEEDWDLPEDPYTGFNYDGDDDFALEEDF